MSEFAKGDRVGWLYKTGRFGHIVLKEKDGDFVAYVRHTRRYYCNPLRPQLAFVHFDGNKRPRKVPVWNLFLIRKC